MPFSGPGRDFPAMRTTLFTFLVVCASALEAQDYSWPREIPVSGGAAGTIVLYQPQAEQLQGNALTARGAIALKVAGRADPIFGAMWMSAAIEVDRDSGMVWIHDVKVSRVRWPDATEDQQRRFTQLVEMDFPKEGFRMTLARLQASLASADAERSHTEGLKSDAPKIMFSEQLAVLLLYDGEPRLQPIPNAPLALVVNTPFGVVKDTTTGTFWLGAGGASWYSAPDAKGPWTAGANPPAAVLKLTQSDTITATPASVDTLFAPAAAPPPTDTARVRTDSAAAPGILGPAAAPAIPTPARTDTATPTPAPAAPPPAPPPPPARPDSTAPPPPAIVTATEPTELVSTQGPPRWKTTAGGKLLYVENTETPWIRETEGRDNYLLIAGRWFKSPAQAGPWSSVRPDSLPASFNDIPPDSPIGGVRSSIALTVEAQDAVLDLQIPQTTVVVRSQATFSAKYDGQPKFQTIPGTLVAYATNTASSVLFVGGAYYACDNAVWFKATNPTGPWVVADSIPRDEIAKIPPSVPVYNVTFVQIYGSTPEVVYVGYTPGYVGTYPYYGVPVYGTGYTYPPYVGTVYYPYPVTYGVSATYNPYTGYGMGTTWGSAFFAFSIGVAIGSSYRYYPPGGYRGCFNCTINVNRGGGNVNRGGGGGRQNVNIGNAAGGGNRQRPSTRPSAGTRPASGNNNLYNRPENRTRNADRSTRQRASSQMGANRTARGQNNVFADRNGNVHRRTSGGWESRQGNNWSRDRAGSNYGRSGGNREYQARQRSSTRSSGGGARGGGGRGGGGRRR